MKDILKKKTKNNHQKWRGVRIKLEKFVGMSGTKLFPCLVTTLTCITWINFVQQN